MWMDRPETVQDEDMGGGEMGEESMGSSRTRTGLVWQMRGRQARRGSIGQGERGVDGRSGRS
jgi:hypothetical protein